MPAVRLTDALLELDEARETKEAIDNTLSYGTEDPKEVRRLEESFLRDNLALEYEMACDQRVGAWLEEDRLASEARSSNYGDYDEDYGKWDWDENRMDDSDLGPQDVAPGWELHWEG
jgi:hypothetical protein